MKGTFFKYVVLELKMTARDRANLFWLFVFPVLFVSMMWVLVGENGTMGQQGALTLGVVNQTRADEAERLVDQLYTAPGFSVSVGDLAAEQKALRQGNRALVVVIEPSDDASPSPFTLNVLGSGDGYDAGLAIVHTALLQSQIDRLPPEVMSPSVPVAAQPRFASPPTYLQSLLVGSMGVSIWVSVANATLVTFVRRRQQGVFRRLRLTAFRPGIYIGAQVVVWTLAACTQIVLLLTFGVVFLDLPVNPWLLLLPGAIVLGTLSFMAFCFTLSGLIRTVESGVSLSSVMISVMLFFGDVLFPVETAPTVVQWISRVVPLSYLNAGLKHLFFFSETPSLALKDFGGLFVWGVIGFLVALKLFRWDKPGKEDK